MIDFGNLSPSEQMNELMKCGLDAEYFIETYIKILVKKGNESYYQPFKLLPHQKKILKNYLENDDNIVSKYRQAGITTLTCAFCVWRLTFTNNFKIALVANKLETSQTEMFKRIADFIEALPDFIKPEYSASKNSQKHKIYANGSEIKALAAGKDGIRGYSPNLVFLDEAAFFEWGESFYTSARLTCAAGGGMIINSTPNGQDKLYYPIYEDAKNSVGSFKLSEVYWYEDERYASDLVWIKNNDEYFDCQDVTKYDNLKRDGYKPSSTWYRKQCIDLKNDPKRIGQELDNNFNASSGLFISELIIKEHEIKYTTEPARKEWKTETWVWEEPQPSMKYVMGCDVSMGVAHGDYSTIIILKITPDNFIPVLEFQGRIAPNELGVLVYEYATRYSAYVVIDNTGGQGQSTISKLFDLGYPKSEVYHSKSVNREMRDSMKDMATINNDEELYPGFIIKTSNRNFILNAFEEATREETFVVKSTRMISELRTFVVKENGKTEHKKGFNDDIIMGCAMAIYVTNSEFNKIKQTPEQLFTTLSILEQINLPTYKRENKTDNWLFAGMG